jgi:hypothetical protein
LKRTAPDNDSKGTAPGIPAGGHNRKALTRDQSASPSLGVRKKPSRLDFWFKDKHSERRSNGGKRSAGWMEADCGFSELIGAFDTRLQKPAFRGGPDFLPKTAHGEKNRLRLGRRFEAVGKTKAHASDPVSVQNQGSKPDYG